MIDTLLESIPEKGFGPNSDPNTTSHRFKKAIDEMLEAKVLEKVTTIGYKKGEHWNLIPYPLLDDEGIICREI